MGTPTTEAFPPVFPHPLQPTSKSYSPALLVQLGSLDPTSHPSPSGPLLHEHSRPLGLRTGCALCPQLLCQLILWACAPPPPGRQARRSPAGGLKGDGLAQPALTAAPALCPGTGAQLGGRRHDPLCLAHLTRFTASPPAVAAAPTSRDRLVPHSPPCLWCSEQCVARWRPLAKFPDGCLCRWPPEPLADPCLPPHPAASAPSVTPGAPHRLQIKSNL